MGAFFLISVNYGQINCFLDIILQKFSYISINSYVVFVYKHQQSKIKNPSTETIPDVISVDETH